MAPADRTVRRLLAAPGRCAHLAAEATVAGFLLPVATLRLVLRVDALLADHATLPAELDRLAGELPGLLRPLHGLAATLERLEPVLGAGAPVLEHLAEALDRTVPVLDELGPVGSDLVPALRQLEELLAEVVGPLRAAVKGLPPDLTPRLVSLLDAVEADLPRIAAVGDPRHGLAAVAANTDHLVELADDLISQVQSLPGANLLRRSRRGRAEQAPLLAGGALAPPPPGGRPANS